MRIVLQQSIANHLDRLNSNPRWVVCSHVYSTRRIEQLKQVELLRRRHRSATYNFPIRQISCLPTNFPACFAPADPLPHSWVGDPWLNRVNVAQRRHFAFQQFYSPTSPLILVSPNAAIHENFPLDDGVRLLRENPNCGCISFQPHGDAQTQLSGVWFLSPAAQRVLSLSEHSKAIDGLRRDDLYWLSVIDRARLTSMKVETDALTTTADFRYDSTWEARLAEPYAESKIKAAFTPIPPHHERYTNDLPSGLTTALPNENWRAVAGNTTYRPTCQYDTGMSRAEFDETIGAIEWRYAKSMPQCPHAWALYAFTIRKSRPTTLEQQIAEAYTTYRLNSYICQNGFVDVWMQKNYRMAIYSGEFKVWCCADDFAFFNRTSEALQQVVFQENKNP